MAALRDSLIRLRLLFDYPPPAVAGCRMCWLLVDLNACRVVADLEGLIRDKFEFSRGSILSLFVEDCYLPHTESILVVRDNDSVRVKVDCAAPVNGCSSCADPDRVKSRKRQRDGGEEGMQVEDKKKKKKKKHEENEVGRSKQETAIRTETPAGMSRKKKKRKKAETSNTPAPKPAAPPRKIPASAPTPAENKKKTAPVPQAKTQSSSSSDSSSQETDSRKRTAARTAPPNPAAARTAPPNPAAARTAPPTPAAAKTPPNTKPPQKNTQPSSSSSSETDSDDSTPMSKRPGAPTVMKQTDAPPQDKGAEPADAGSEEEIQLVIRRPQLPNRHADGLWSGRGRGRGGRGGAGQAAGWGFRGQDSNEGPSPQTNSPTDMPALLQNGAGDAPRQDYSSMPLLAAPAQVGQRIAFKLLELTENYTPEVSEYKEAKIVSFDPTTKQIELELLHASKAPVEPGKFDLVYLNPDGSERVEYAVSRGSKVTERWESLLEPRLIL
ncbi:Coilin [Oryzias melastigma]|uniref:Coilin n=1 Tax=Oryzias melastigma TaxID=30732 RepID=A0A834C0V8_ORYME|nr:Coilin [Oryzias melastigma]